MRRRAAAALRGAAPGAAWAAGGSALLALGYLPAARVPVIADDFQALQETYAVSDGSLVEALTFGVGQGTAAGHFNPVGQAVGATWHWSLYAVSARLNVDPHHLDALGGYLLVWLAVAAGTAAVLAGLRRAARPALRTGYWPLFAVTAAVTGATLQIHAPWTNDPVVSYGPAGFGSAALGLALLAVAVRATDPSSSRWLVVAAGGLATACVWYYEMLVAAVVAVAALAGLLLLTARGAAAGRERLRCAAVLGAAVVVPAVAFLAGRRLAEPQTTESYDGTALALGGEALRTWVVGMLGTLPTTAWGFVEERTGGIALTRADVVLGGLLAAGTGLLLALLALLARGAEPGRLLQRVPVVVGCALLVLSALSTASHAVTRKYIEEIQEVGQIYLFYAVGVVVAALAMSVLLVAAVARPRGRAALVLLAPLAGALVVGQVAVNRTVADFVREETYPVNRQLAALSVEPASDPALRCDVLEAWRAEQWPEYYRTAVTEDVQENFARVYGQPFCPAPLARQRGIPVPAADLP